MGNGNSPSNVQERVITPEQPDSLGGRAADPVARMGVFVLGVYFTALAVLIFYFLVATWPVSDPKDASAFVSFSLFGSSPFSAPPDLRLFFTVIAAGALGSLIHSITSFADYVGNRNLGKSWIWWLILRTPVGVALALLFYLVLRGGLVVPSLPNGSASTNATHLLNPYGIAAISAMAGMFAKQATDKLREIFDTLFRTREPVTRADPLARTKPIILSTQPPKLVVGGPLILNVIGRGFQRDCTVSINGKPRNVQWLNDTRIAVTLVAEDLTVKTQLEVMVHNPGPGGGDSDPFRVPVEDA